MQAISIKVEFIKFMNLGLGAYIAKKSGNSFLFYKRSMTHTKLKKRY